MQSEEYTYQQLKQLDLKASVYRSSASEANHTILYFHGGGLVYGERNDLPEEYISLFLEAGYHFISFDYPLAPESNLQDIYAAVKKAVSWFNEQAKKDLSFATSSYSLFGRSAGAYLCFLLANDSSLPKADRLIDFYGYDSLEYEGFSKPNQHYTTYPKLPKAMVDRMIQPQPIAFGPIQTRYALYLYARQTGKWMDFLGVSAQDPSNQFSLKENDLKHLPPTFIAHSTGDKDVPYSIAEKLSVNIPNNQLYTVKEKEHDFDREPTAPQATEAYQSLLQWLAST